MGQYKNLFLLQPYYNYLAVTLYDYCLAIIFHMIHLHVPLAKRYLSNIGMPIVLIFLLLISFSFFFFFAI